MRSADGLMECSRQCMREKKSCQRIECRKWIDFPTDQNCCLISIYENGPMTLRIIAERLGISFARVKQIESAAIEKIKKRTSILKLFF
jgi:transcriptional regulator